MYLFKLIKNSSCSEIKSLCDSAIVSWLAKWSSSDISISISAEDAFDKEGFNTSECMFYQVNDTALPSVLLLYKKDTNPFHMTIFNSSCDNDGVDTGAYGYVTHSAIVELFNELNMGDFTLTSNNIIKEYFDSEQHGQLFKKGVGTILVTVTLPSAEFYVLFPSKIYAGTEDVVATGENGLNSKLLCDYSIIPDDEVQANVVLERTKISLGELKNLQRDDILVLEHKTSSLAKLIVGSTEIASVALGKRDNKRAIFITDNN